jgi:large subunit ribosomal protein L31e
VHNQPPQENTRHVVPLCTPFNSFYHSFACFAWICLFILFGWLVSSHSAFKKKAPRAIKEVRKFVSKLMGTEDVRIETGLNKWIWNRGEYSVPFPLPSCFWSWPFLSSVFAGVRNVPTKIRVRVSRKVNDDDDAKHKTFASPHPSVLKHLHLWFQHKIIIVWIYLLTNLLSLLQLCQCFIG